MKVDQNKTDTLIIYQDFAQKNSNGSLNATALVNNQGAGDKNSTELIIA
jgi:hypothetical protein